MPPSLSKYQLSPVLCPYCYCSLLCPWSSEQCLETQSHLYSLDTKYIFVELMDVCGSILSLLLPFGRLFLFFCVFFWQAVLNDLKQRRSEGGSQSLEITVFSARKISTREKFPWPSFLYNYYNLVQ